VLSYLPPSNGESFLSFNFIYLLRGKCSDLLLSFEKLDGLLNQLDECFVVFGDGSWLIAGYLLVGGGVCLLSFRLEVCLKIVQNFVGDFAMTWNYAFDVDLEKGVGVGLVVVVKRGEKGIVKLLLLARLIALLTEAEDHLFHFFLRKFGRLSNILDLVPGFLFALCIWHR